tara:strand:+ start:80 stop:985 length:906 start_codon:yes stop_codon:yes gene_type:complete
MISLNDNEKVILQKNSSLLNGLSQKTGKLYLTNKRLIFEDKKNSSDIIYIKIEEIKSYKELRILLKFNTGIDVSLENGINYCFTLGLGFKSFLSKLEEVKGNTIPRETGVKHMWFPNIIFGGLILFWVIIPTVNFIGSSFDNIMYKLDPIGYIENVDKTNKDVSYDFEIDSEDFYYPNLHGEWGFYDSHNDKNFNLIIKLNENEFSQGNYEVWTKWDSDEKWKMEEEGKFEIGRSKDQYGDSNTLGYRVDDLKYKSDYNDRRYIFSVNSMVDGYGLRLGPRFEVWNSMFGKRMTKVSNKPN